MPDDYKNDSINNYINVTIRKSQSEVNNVLHPLTYRHVIPVTQDYLLLLQEIKVKRHK